MNLHSLSDLHVLALTIWGEARGEPVEGQIAVANVVRNRWRDAAETTTWAAVCLKPRQFSCWNASDPNYQKVLRTAEQLQTDLPTPELRQALWIAAGVMSGSTQDNTEGSTHYLSTELLEAHPPTWAANQPVLVTIGNHSFLQVA